MTVRHITDIPGYPAPHSPYSHAVVVANGFVFVSGQIPVRPGGGPTEIAGTTMQAQHPPTSSPLPHRLALTQLVVIRVGGIGVLLQQSRH